MKIKEFINYEQPNDYIVSSEHYNQINKVPVLTAGQSFVLGFTDDKDGIYTKGNCIIFDDFTTSVHYVDFPFKVKSSAMKILTTNKNADLKYCYYLLLSISKMPTNHKRQWISTTSEKEWKLPAFEKQKSIADILDSLTATINDYKKEINMLDNLIKARFIELFGSIYDGEYELKKLPEIVNKDKNAIKRGPFGGTLKKDDFVDNGYLVYEQRHAIHNDFDYAKYYITQKKYDDMIAFKVVPGDLIISCSGVTLGRIAEVPKGAKEGIINQALLKLSLNQQIMLNTFFIHQFRGEEIQEILFGFSRGSGIPNMPSMSEVKSVKFICPPLELQKEYCEFVEQTDKSKFIQMIVQYK